MRYIPYKKKKLLKCQTKIESRLRLKVKYLSKKANAQ